MSKFSNPYVKAEYVLNAHRLNQLPDDTGAEVAFAGRSNAGKSSAVNTLTQQKSLARVSKTPGRTQQIVVFQLDETRRLMDLPGYGYAKVPLKLKEHWIRLMDQYFASRQSLQGVVLMMDVRHPLKPFDEQMLGWCEAARLPCHVLLTKADKLKRGPGMSALQKLERSLPYGCTAQLFSAKTRDGLPQLIEQLNTWLAIHPKNSTSETLGPESESDTPDSC